MCEEKKSKFVAGKDLDIFIILQIFPLLCEEEPKNVIWDLLVNSFLQFAIIESKSVLNL